MASGRAHPGGGPQYSVRRARLGEKRVFLLGACAFCLLWPLWALTWASAAALGPAWREIPGAGTVWALLAGSFVAYMGTQFCFGELGSGCGKGQCMLT